MNKTTIVIPVMGSLHQTKSFWGLLLETVGKSDLADLFVIDNSPDEDAKEFIEFYKKFIIPHWKAGVARYFHPQNNIGVVRSLQHAYENTSTPYLVFMHNDLYIYKSGWVADVEEIFDNRNQVGLIGVFGGLGLHRSGMRFENSSNMLEAEIHGYRRNGGSFRCTVIDGMFMACQRTMLDAKRGFDVGYDIHHFYDLDISMESINRGFENWAIMLPVHHVNGVTANGKTFNDWADDYIPGGQIELYKKNQLRFTSKWLGRLPYDVRLAE